jgi:hypothetical protein
MSLGSDADVAAHASFQVTVFLLVARGHVYPVNPHADVNGTAPLVGIASFGSSLLAAQLGSAARSAAVTAAEQREVFSAASFRIVPRLQEPGFGVSAHSRLVRCGGRRLLDPSEHRLLLGRRDEK